MVDPSGSVTAPYDKQHLDGDETSERSANWMVSIDGNWEDESDDDKRFLAGNNINYTFEINNGTTPLNTVTNTTNSPTAGAGTIGIAVVSYAGEMVFGLNADRMAAPAASRTSGVRRRWS